MSMWGMDIHVIREVGIELENQGESLDRVGRTIDQLVHRAQQNWRGNDADQFAHAWSGRHRQLVQGLAHDLRWLGATALREAEQQEVTSRADAGPVTQADLSRFAGERLRDVLKALERAFSALGTVGTASPCDTEEGSYLVDRENLALARAAEAGRRSVGSNEQQGDTILGPGGFEARVYADPDGNVRIVFPGTNFNSADDVLSDLDGAGNITTQDKQAVELALRIKGQLKPGQTLEMVGHSLGGRLASVAAIATGAHATTFNAAGPSPAAIAYAEAGGKPDLLRDTMGFARGIVSVGVGYHYDGADHLVTNYRTNNDLLTGLQEGRLSGPLSGALPAAIGTQVNVRDDATSGVLQGGEAHKLDAIQRGMSGYAADRGYGKVLGDPGASNANMA